MADNNDGCFTEQIVFSLTSHRNRIVVENHNANTMHHVVYGHKILFVWSSYFNIFSCPKSEHPMFDQSFTMHICLSLPCMSYLEFF